MARRSSQGYQLQFYISILYLQRFNSFFSRTTWVSRYQKGKTSLDLNEARDNGVLGCSGISWTICKQSAPRCRQDNHINTSSLNFYRPDALPDVQPIASKHWRHFLFQDSEAYFGKYCKSIAICNKMYCNLQYFSYSVLLMILQCFYTKLQYCYCNNVQQYCTANYMGWVLQLNEFNK